MNELRWIALFGAIHFFVPDYSAVQIIDTANVAVRVAAIMKN
jgi:hypothetical protein